MRFFYSVCSTLSIPASAHFFPQDNTTTTFQSSRPPTCPNPNQQPSERPQWRPFSPFGIPVTIIIIRLLLSLTLTLIRQSLHEHDIMKYVLRSSIQRCGVPTDLNVFVYIHLIRKLIDRKYGMLLLFLSRILCLNLHKRKRKRKFWYSSPILYGRKLI